MSQRNIHWFLVMSCKVAVCVAVVSHRRKEKPGSNAELLTEDRFTPILTSECETR